MMKSATTLLALTAFGAMTACATVPLAPVVDIPAAEPTVQLSSQDRLIRAIEGQGCVLNENNVGAILASASVTPDEVRQIVPALETEGRAEVASDGEIRILSPNCI